MDNNKNAWWYDRGWLYRSLIALFALLAIFVFFKIISEWKAFGYIGTDANSRSVISVNGLGEVFGKPDIATFTFAVTEESAVVVEAQNEATKEMNDILAYLKKEGIEDKDIQTTYYNVYPRYEYPRASYSAYYTPPEGKRILVAYVVTQGISVKVRDLSKAGKLVSGIGELGASDISGLQFTIEEEETLKKEAREKAIADAESKAEELADELGVSLVRIVSYSEGGNYPIYYDMKAASGMGGSASAPVPELPAGENKIVSNVTITYEIR